MQTGMTIAGKRPGRVGGVIFGPYTRRPNPPSDVWVVLEFRLFSVWVGGWVWPCWAAAGCQV